MTQIEIRIPHDLIDKAWRHPDVRKYTDYLANQVCTSVNRRLQGEGVNIEYRVNSGVRGGNKPRPFANVYPVSTGDTGPRDWTLARRFLQVAIDEQSKGR